MVNQREAPRVPPSSERQNAQRNNPHAHPEFGRPSMMGLPQMKSNRDVPFNIPKPNRPRPEHHRPAGALPQHSAGNTGNMSTPAFGTGAPKPSAKPFDPFKPVKPSAY